MNVASFSALGQPRLALQVLDQKSQTWYATWAEAEPHVGPNKGPKFDPTMFPSTSERAAEFHLERCMRFLPHHQDTGGLPAACCSLVGTVMCVQSASRLHATGLVQWLYDCLCTVLAQSQTLSCVLHHAQLAADFAEAQAAALLHS